MKKGLYSRQIVALKNLKERLVADELYIKVCNDNDKIKKVEANIKRIKREIITLEKRIV